MTILSVFSTICYGKCLFQQFLRDFYFFVNSFSINYCSFLIYSLIHYYSIFLGIPSVILLKFVQPLFEGYSPGNAFENSFKSFSGNFFGNVADNFFENSENLQRNCWRNLHKYYRKNSQHNIRFNFKMELPNQFPKKSFAQKFLRATAHLFPLVRQIDLVFLA